MSKVIRETIKCIGVWQSAVHKYCIEKQIKLLLPMKGRTMEGVTLAVLAGHHAIYVQNIYSWTYSKIIR